MTGLVLLASYPKSGNTWVRAALDALERGGAEVDINALAVSTTAANREWFDDFLGIDSADLTEGEMLGLRARMTQALAAQSRPRLMLKTHDAWHAPTGCPPPFPVGSVAAAVVIVRDPRDVAVSWAHHLGRSIDVAIQRMANSEDCVGRSVSALNLQLPQFLSSWSLHVQGWLDAPVPLHRINYEDMRADPTATLAALARFLDLPSTAEAIASAVAATSFAKLRGQEEQSGFRERPDQMVRFFRRGQAGGWRDSLSAAQVARIEQDHGPVMHRLGYLP